MSVGRAILGNLAALGVGLAVAGLISEGVARWRGVGGPAGLDPAFDREAVYVLPEASRASPYAAGAEDPLKVAVIGDSFTVGQANQWYDAFPARLERLMNLNDGVRPVQVVAYARKGMSTADQRRFLFPAIRDGADLILLAVFLNDTEDAMDPEIHEWKARLRPRVPAGWRLALLKRSRSLSWLYQRWELARCHRAQLEFTAYCFDEAYRGWGRFSDAVARFGSVTRAEGVPLVAVVFPPMAHLAEGVYPYDYAHEKIEAKLAENDIPFLDLRPVFVGRDTQRIAAYPGIDAHPSEIGHRLAAHEIFRYLIREGYLHRSYIPRRFEVERESDWLLQVRQMRSVAFVDEVEVSPVEDEFPAPKRTRGGKRKRRAERAAAAAGEPVATDPSPAAADAP